MVQKCIMGSSGGGGVTPLEADNFYFYDATVSNQSLTLTVASDIKNIYVLRGYYAGSAIGCSCIYDYHNPTQFVATTNWQVQTSPSQILDINGTSGEIRSVNGDTVQFYFDTGGNSHWVKIVIRY